MARYGQRPENALKRANEFIDVGKPARALDTLQEVFRNKKWAYSWSESVLEPIMFKYLDLCVELKKSHIAKEGLFQYRNMFQLVNVGSLENVIRGYLRMAEEKTEAAQQQCSQAVVDIDDLDNLATPESILMSAVCGEDAQDRSERTILTPWVKFLWESYCQCLELLRTNAHVETLYHDIARMAFQFCLKYNRKTEFRKLCDKLRKHLEDICKLTVQTTNVSINKPETQQLNLDTRLFQLDSAIQMELWQEAYKAIEDIHGLMNMSKKQPVAKTMANYYQKLSMVFWKAGNQLFHAAALLKLFQLSREMKKNITGDELQRMACRVLLSTLAIPLPSAHPEFDRFIETDKSPLEKAQRLAILLGLQQPPTRATLLRDIVRMNVVQLASPQLKQLYGWLETEFDPLLLCERVHSVIETLNADEGNTSLQQYIPALQDVTLVRLVRQVSQVYQSIEFARLLQLAKFTTDFHLERLLVDCVRHNDMQIRIDHAKRSIHFGMDLSESQREDRPEGPTLQSMPSEQVRNQLVNMATTLHQAITAINPNRKKTEREKLRTQLVQHYHENKVKEHQRILLRHKIIEDRKEYIERLNTVREEEEQRRQEEVQRLQQLAEQRRLELEREEREKKRQANERQQIKDRNLKEKVQKILQTSHGQRVLKKLDEEEMKKMDAEQIAAKEAEELFKERRELQAKLKSQEKKVDYFERAKRIEEIPLIQKSLEEKQVQDKKFWEQQETTRIAQAVAERAQAVAQQARLARIITEKQEFLDILKAERRHVYEDKLKVFNIMLEEERSRRLAERVKQRREERRQKWLREKEEEAHRAEEAIRRAREEELRLEQEKKAQEEKERLEMVERSAAKQRARDEELEKRERERGAERERERDRDRERDRSDKDKEGSRTWRSGPWTERDGERDTKTQDSWRSQNPPTPAPSAAAPVPAVTAATIPAAADGAKEAPTPWRSKIRTEPAKPAASEVKDGARPWKPAEKGADLRTRDTDGERGPEKREVSDRHENEDRSQFDDRRFISRLPPRDRDDHFNNRDREKPRDREERGGFERRPERRDGDHFDRQPAREERGGERRFDDRRRDDRGGFNRSENNEDSREQPERRDWRMTKRGEPEDDRPRRVPISRDRGPPPTRGPPRGDREREPRDREPREEGGDWRNAAKGAEPPQREWRTTRPEKSAPPREATREATREAPAPSDGEEWHRVKKR